MDFERARFNMIGQQIRPWNVLDPSVLALLRKVPREQFVTTRQQALAFADLSIPLDHDQVMMQPKVEARLIQALALTRQDRVLEIGTGSGYLTALLAASAASVVSVEIYSALSLQAGARLQSAGFDTVDLKIGDGAAGWPGSSTTFVSGAGRPGSSTTFLLPGPAGQGRFVCLPNKSFSPPPVD